MNIIKILDGIGLIGLWVKFFKKDKIYLAAKYKFEWKIL